MKPTLLIIGLVWPEPNSSAAGSRMMQLIQLFLNQNYKIVFASAAQESEFSYTLENLGIECQPILLNSDTFNMFVRNINPTIVLFDRYISEEQFGWRVAENCPNALRILDTEDLHCLRYARQKAVKNQLPFEMTLLLDESVSLREIASIYRCDLSLIISDYEMEILEKVFRVNNQLLFYLPLCMDVITDWTSYQNRKDFIFIGNFWHEPNWDAVLQLKKMIWPKIASKLKDAKLHIYGAYCSEKAFQLHHEKDRFLVWGRAEEALVEIAKVKVLVAPLRFGAGIKGKLLEAMSVGTPSVTTTIGNEGIASVSEWNGFVADDWEIFSDTAIELYQNEALWNSKQQFGKKILEERFQLETYQNSFFQMIDQILENINKHRQLNFLGKLLYHHQFASAKFMSKWITEKNNKNTL